MNPKNSRTRSREINLNKILQPNEYQDPPYYQNKNRSISNKQLIKHAISLPRQPEGMIQDKRNHSQINSLHQQYNLLKDQMKKFPEKNKSNDSEVFLRAKERSQAVYVEDQKSQSSEEGPYYRRVDVLAKKRELFPPFDDNQKIEENYFRKSFKKSQKESLEAYSNDSKHSKEKESSSSSQANKNANIQSMKNSSQSSPPLPSRKSTAGPQTKTSKEFSEMLTPDKEGIRIPHFNSQRPYNIKSKLQKFSMEIQNGMENMLDRFEELEKKYLSLDLYFEQLKRSVAQRSNAQSKDKEVSQAKHRQLNFLLGQYEAKVKQVKADNERLEKQLISAKIREEYSKGKLLEAQLRYKDMEKTEQSFEKMKKAKIQIEKNLQQAESKASRLQRQKANLQVQLQREKSRKAYDAQHIILKEQANLSHFVSSSTLFGTSEDTDYLKQQISKLQYENKEYEKLINQKSLQISNLTRSMTDNKMMMNKIKELNEQLERQCQKLHKENAQKQLQATEKICGLNNNIKKKLKEYDNFKDLVLDCLTEIYKKAPKKIRKGFEAEMSNKNRTSKCQVIFKCINSTFAYYEDLTNTINESLLRDFPISPIELEKSGYQACLKKIKQESTKLIESSKAQNRALHGEVQKLKGELLLKSQEVQSLKQHEQEYFVLKKGRSQNPKKDVPTNDFDTRQTQSATQQLVKRKGEIDKLNKEVNRLIEESHGKYLKYQEQMANLQIKEKQYVAKIAEIQLEKGEITTKITEKQNQLKVLQRNIIEIKAERETLTARIAELSNQTKKLVMQSQNKLHRSQQEIQALKKKVKKAKEQKQQSEKLIQIKMTVKDKTINDLLEEKKKSMVQMKILTEKIEFARIMEDNKERSSPKNVQSLPQRINKQQIEKLEDKMQKMEATIKQQEEQIKRLGSIIKNINLNLTQKEKLLEKAHLQLQKKQEQIEKLSKQYKQKQSRKSHMNEQYKKMAQQAKRARQELQKKMQQEKQKKNKELAKMAKHFQVKEQEYLNLTRQKTDDAHKCKDLEQKLSQNRRQNEELLNLVHKRQYEIQQKESTIKSQRETIKELQNKCHLLEAQLRQRQEYFKKSESLMQQLVNQNNQNKIQMEKKEQQILVLIQQKQELNFRLSEDLDEKSQNMKMVRQNHQGQLALLKEQLQATQMNLQTTKEELRLKNALIAQLKQKGSSDRKEPSMNKQPRQDYQTKISEYCEEIENLNNRIDILQEQLEQMKVCLHDRQVEMDAAKRDKNKYYKILQQKAEYIDQLQEAVKLKFSDGGPMREVNEDIQELREQYEENEERLKQEIQDLHQKIKQLQQKSIQAVNSLKKEVEALKKQAQDTKDQLQVKNAKNKILISQKQQVAKQLQKKEGELINLMHKYEQFKVKASQELNAKSEYLQEVLADKENYEEKLKLYSEMMLMKQKIYKQEVEEITSQLKAKDQQISSLQKHQVKEQQPITEHKSQNQPLSLTHRASKLIITRLQEEKAQLTRKVNSLEKELSEKLGILQNLNFKIEQMDSNISDLQYKLQTVKHENKNLKMKLQKMQNQTEQRSSQQLQEQLQRRLKELDEKQHQLHQIKEQHKRALKAQAHQFSTNLENYRSNFGILQKQLNTYKETNIILTLKCQSLEKQFRELAQRKDNSKNFIVSQSPNNLDFASVQLDPPDKSNVLKNMLSQSLFDIDA